jgi:8-oxo-dGTP pyrophosphatase MutT (NUDIX family)
MPIARQTDEQSKVSNNLQMMIYPQSAVIPFRIVDGKLEILLITARGGNRWIIPKGIIENGMTPQASAAQEAYEEAGIRGQINPKPVGKYEYEKWGGVCRVQVFLMQIEETLEIWPEQSFRKRRWVAPETASEIVNEPALKSLLAELPKLLKRASTAERR